MNVRTKTDVTEETRQREPLTRDRIIEAALRVMDAESLEAVTMRRIGRELGVEAMSLYNHVEDKDDILEGVTERVMNEFEFPPSTGDWAEDAREMAREWRRLLGLHPSVCQLLAERHKPLDGLATFRAMDSALGVLRRAGMSARDAAQAFNALGRLHPGLRDDGAGADARQRRRSCSGARPRHGRAAGLRARQRDGVLPLLRGLHDGPAVRLRAGSDDPRDPGRASTGPSPQPSRRPSSAPMRPNVSSASPRSSSV